MDKEHIVEEIERKIKTSLKTIFDEAIDSIVDYLEERPNYQSKVRRNKEIYSSDLITAFCKAYINSRYYHGVCSKPNAVNPIKSFAYDMLGGMVGRNIKSKLPQRLFTN